VLLPNHDGARVDREKITDYLLAHDHPEGASKADFFTRFGFAAADWSLLAQALLAHAAANPVSAVINSPYGTKYRVDGPIACPDGRSPVIRVVWIIDGGANAPRLVTAHPI
jgi:hypothetical protein